MSEKTTVLRKKLGNLFLKSLSLSTPLYQLQFIRETLEGRSFQDFDKEDIMDQLGRLQHSMREFENEMLQIHDLLKRK